MKKLKTILILLAVISVIFVLTGCPDAGAGTATPGTDTDTEQAADDGTDSGDGSGTTTPDPVPVYYSVTYDANGATSGSAPVDNTGYEDGASADIADSSAPLARDGYIFAAWCTTADSTGDIYAEGDTITMGAADVTLYARWVKRGFIADGTALGNSYGLGGSVDLNEDGSIMIADLSKYLSSRGAVVFYNRNDEGNWEHDSLFTLSAGTTQDNFGADVAINDEGTVAVAGAYKFDALDADDNPVSGSGCAAIFTYENDSWILKHELTADIPQDGAGFGYSVDVSGDGNTIVVGEYSWDNTVTTSLSDSGRYHIFTTTDNWDTYAQRPLADSYSRYTQAGYSVALNYDGSRIIGGTFYGLTMSKPVYIYDSDDNWTTFTRKRIYSIVNNGQFGTEVDCTSDGNLICIGDSGANDTGEVYLYKLEEDTWTLVETLLPSDTAVGSGFGKNIAVSNDGKKIYIGNNSEDTYGSNSGMAYLFELNNGIYDRFDTFIQESFSDVDHFGSAVAVSGDGKVVAAGGKYIDTYGDSSGDVFFYTFEE